MARANLRTYEPAAAMPDFTVLDALGVPFAQAATVSSTGFALVGADARVTWSTAAFARLVRLKGSASGVCLVPHLQTEFRLADGEAERAFVRPDASTLELHEGRDGAPVLLHVAALDAAGAAVGPVDAGDAGGAAGNAGASGAVRVVVAVAGDAARAGGAGNALRETHTDPLTRLGNRKLLEHRLAGPQHADGSSLALVVLGLDRFGPVNDVLGRATGDKLLMLVADRLKRACRAADTVARLGGDEFAILRPCRPGGESAEPVAARIVELMARPFLVDGREVHVGASVGIACLGSGTAVRADLLRHADLALHDAKRAGRGTWRRFDPPPQDTIR